MHGQTIATRSTRFRKDFQGTGPKQKVWVQWTPLRDHVDERGTFQKKMPKLKERLRMNYQTGSHHVVLPTTNTRLFLFTSTVIGCARMIQRSRPRLTELKFRMGIFLHSQEQTL